MRLNKFTDYNLRVLIYLALNRSRLCTIQEVAGVFSISENHLMKVIHHLAKHDTIISKRGKGEGIRLDKEPDELSLAKIVRDAEGEPRLVDCQEYSNVATCRISPVCNLPKLLHEASQAFYNCLEQYTLADILQDNDQQLRYLLAIDDIKVTQVN